MVSKGSNVTMSNSCSASEGASVALLVGRCRLASINGASELISGSSPEEASAAGEAAAVGSAVGWVVGEGVGVNSDVEETVAAVVTVESAVGVAVGVV